MPPLDPSRVAALGLLLLAVGTWGFYFIPGLIVDDENSQNRLVTAFYCATVTLTTVGYGDLCPSKDLQAQGQFFLILLVFGGVGFFTGPVLNQAAAWRHSMVSVTALGSLTIGVGMSIFTALEGYSHKDALYASVITGTTIGYGDRTPDSDLGKILIALYIIVAIPAVAVLLEPGKRFLEDLCRRKELPPVADKDL